ncbi:nucleotidyltransferase domain-containing protein [Methanobrevibacter sp.]
MAHEFANAINSDKIVRIILFGSVARGEDTEYSDIDILIVSDY